MNLFGADVMENEGSVYRFLLKLFCETTDHKDTAAKNICSDQEQQWCVRVIGACGCSSGRGVMVFDVPEEPFLAFPQLVEQE